MDSFRRCLPDADSLLKGCGAQIAWRRMHSLSVVEHLDVIKAWALGVGGAFEVFAEFLGLSPYCSCSLIREQPSRKTPLPRARLTHRFTSIATAAADGGRHNVQRVAHRLAIRSTAAEARALEIFLDRLGQASCPELAYVLDDDYADALTSEERALCLRVPRL